MSHAPVGESGTGNSRRESPYSPSNPQNPRMVWSPKLPQIPPKTHAHAPKAPKFIPKSTRDPQNPTTSF
ncbi:hypothetical protein IHE44_0001345 [Lamprotornis superbus]|uniref:Uncharacterized protein n=1 Tax=Lamprotornis superbus TaxID=245042 RepID=A0A835NES2_9PASS|nr:hypothetical protein IHE44_0001345 [Lamprotornis superbus]